MLYVANISKIPVISSTTPFINTRILSKFSNVELGMRYHHTSHLSNTGLIANKNLDYYRLLNQYRENSFAEKRLIYPAVSTCWRVMIENHSIAKLLKQPIRKFNYRSTWHKAIY